jgi:hypothetical protein
MMGVYVGQSRTFREPSPTASKTYRIAVKEINNLGIRYPGKERNCIKFCSAVSIRFMGSEAGR